MKITSGVGLLGAVLLLAGCANPGPVNHSGGFTGGTATAPVIRPDLRITGQVAMVNAEARFVVVTFPAGPMPGADKHFNVYRGGLKVGEVKITGPQHDNDTVADIITGDVQVQDQVRED